jgi:hypothetical protein
MCMILREIHVPSRNDKMLIKRSGLQGMGLRSLGLPEAQDMLLSHSPKGDFFAYLTASKGLDIWWCDTNPSQLAVSIG